jgi:hypothetical protein
MSLPFEIDGAESTSFFFSLSTTWGKKQSFDEGQEVYCNFFFFYVCRSLEFQVN